MTEIDNFYTGQKRDNFLKQLNECSIDRFKELSTEKDRLTIVGVREAETILQSEFEGHHEQNSMTRMTNAEYAAGNMLDGRFRIGILSYQPNTLNQKFTDHDEKVLVSDQTLQDQANQRWSLGHRNTHYLKMYEQGKETGYSIILQKDKHCDPSIVEKPSMPENVKHIVNLIELFPNEVRVAKKGVLDGAK